jgi:hypothetical protein
MSSILNLSQLSLNYLLIFAGLDCQFLQGDATDKSEISKFWQNLSKSDGYATLDILNYNKFNTLHHNSLYCFPLIDNCGPGDAPQVSHIAVVLTASHEVHHSAECCDLLEDRSLEEVGMPLDRREGYVCYHAYRLAQQVNCRFVQNVTLTAFYITFQVWCLSPPERPPSSTLKQLAQPYRWPPTSPLAPLHAPISSADCIIG